MKRYLLFYIQEYYPNGGMNDLKGSYDIWEEASFHATVKEWATWQILDTNTGVVYDFNDAMGKFYPDHVVA